MKCQELDYRVWFIQVNNEQILKEFRVEDTLNKRVVGKRHNYYTSIHQVAILV